MRPFRAVTILTVVGLLGVAGCGGAETSSGDGSGDRMLGPVDGHDLPPTDLQRVDDGDVAPDFTLAAYQGADVTLSGFRGSKNVVLVFYRGHW